MIDPTEFEASILRPLILRLEEKPNDLANAYCATWAVDSYASHVAIFLEGEETTRTTSAIERDFKNRLCDLEDHRSWAFEVLREASNATKHAARDSPVLGIRESSSLQSQKIDGYLWYWMGATHWGEQIVVVLDPSHKIEGSKWAMRRNRIKNGSMFPWVPVLDLSKTAVELVKDQLERDESEGS